MSASTGDLKTYEKMIPIMLSRVNEKICIQNLLSKYTDSNMGIDQLLPIQEVASLIADLGIEVFGKKGELVFHIPRMVLESYQLSSCNCGGIVGRLTSKKDLLSGYAELKPPCDCHNHKSAHKTEKL